MDIFISGSKDGITMVEGCGMEFPEDRLLNILDEVLILFYSSYKLDIRYEI
jgi:hypothetical protein